MTIRIGPIDRIRVCYSTSVDVTSSDAPPRSLCRDGGAPWRTGLTIFTKDPAKITCTHCIEWMHA